jgi:hypothetical protein
MPLKNGYGQKAKKKNPGMSQKQAGSTTPSTAAEAKKRRKK